MARVSKPTYGRHNVIADRRHQSFLAGFAIEALKLLGPVAISTVVESLSDHEKANVPTGAELKAMRDELALPPAPEPEPPISGAVVAE